MNIYHDMLIEKSAYETEEWGDEGITAYLTQEQPGVYGWDHIGVDEAQWNTDPDTEYIAFAMGRNANDEWGPLARLEFRTPGLSGVSDLTSTMPVIRVTGSQVCVLGMQPGSAVSVYDLSGRLVGKTTVSSRGEANISIGHLNSGAYVVTDGKTSHKFVK